MARKRDGAASRAVWRRALERCATCVANARFFPDEWPSPEAGVELLLRRVCPLLGVSRERIDSIVMFEEEQPRAMIGIPVPSQNFAGLYAVDAAGREHVVVKLGAHSDPASVVAILAHELCHVLLFGDGKIGREVEDGEPLTDLLCVVLGFGVICANAVFCTSTYSDARGQGWKMRRQGYLSEAELAYALALWTRKRGELKPAWARHLDRNAQTYFQQSLRFLQWRDQQG